MTNDIFDDIKGAVATRVADRVDELVHDDTFIAEALSSVEVDLTEANFRTAKNLLREIANNISEFSY